MENWLLLTETGRETSSVKRIGTFQCDAALHVGNVRGEVAERLHCDPSELDAYGWLPYLHKESEEAIQRMGRELAGVRAGRYPLRATSKAGERLDMQIRTFILHKGETARIEGVIDLLAWASPRRHFDLGA